MVGEKTNKQMPKEVRCTLSVIAIFFSPRAQARKMSETVGPFAHSFTMDRLTLLLCFALRLLAAAARLRYEIEGGRAAAARVHAAGTRNAERKKEKESATLS